MEWWHAYLLLGVVVGFFAGLLGIGGGLILVPVLTFIFTAQHFPPDRILHFALGTTMAAIIFYLGFQPARSPWTWGGELASRKTYYPRNYRWNLGRCDARKHAVEPDAQHHFCGVYLLRGHPDAAENYAPP